MHITTGQRRGIAIRTGIFLLIAGTFATTTRAGLKPEEIVILAVKDSQQSRELADYYAQARAIPKSHIYLLEVKPGEALSRADWEAKVRPAIRRWLKQAEFGDKIRCLVTVWDVPLKVGPIDNKHPALTELKANFDAQRKIRQSQLVDLAQDIDNVLPAKDRPRPAAPAASATKQEFAEFLERSLTDAKQRLREWPDRATDEWRSAVSRLDRLYSIGGGVKGVARSFEQQVQQAPTPPPEILRAADFRRGEVTGLNYGVQALAGLRESPDRDLQILAMVQQSDGLIGTLEWIEESQKLWQKNETYASFDSELALLWQAEYPLLRWYGNALHYGADRYLRQTMPQTLMVARIEAPTIELARRLIDRAIEIEAKGLTGKVYIDARGIKEDVRTPGSYGNYDQSLRDLASLLKEQTGLKVVLDDKPDLFKADDCPDAALYCGWYSLENYVDAFEWKPGAVGYHMASAEAKSLRDRDSKAWCKRMLEDGVGATLGPTYEPYIVAFPRPLDFFSLLLTGKYTLAEVYARTNPFNSWVMVLVGDPLYNPYLKNPQLDADQLPEPLRRVLADER